MELETLQLTSTDPVPASTGARMQRLLEQRAAKMAVAANQDVYTIAQHVRKIHGNENEHVFKLMDMERKHSIVQ